MTAATDNDHQGPYRTNAPPQPIGRYVGPPRESPWHRLGFVLACLTGPSTIMGGLAALSGGAFSSWAGGVFLVCLFLWLIGWMGIADGLHARVSGWSRRKRLFVWTWSPLFYVADPVYRLGRWVARGDSKP